MNNREIKFRAWDTKSQRMFNDVSIGTVHIFDDSYSFKNSAESKDCEFMQFTGLKDKNGKEIYEGDIVEYEEPRFESGMMKSEVIFSLGCFEVGGNSFSEFRHPDIDLEVIGNTYENPDLLK